MSDIQKLFQANPEFRESRLKSLFSDFSEMKESNPEGYMANLNVWKHFLDSVFEKEKTLAFNYEKFQKLLSYRTTKNDFFPQGLYIVLNSMVNVDNSILLTSELYEDGNSGRSIFGLLKSLISGKKETDVRFVDCDLVCVSNLEHLCDKVRNPLLPLIEKDAISPVHLHDILNRNGMVIDFSDLELCLVYMCKRSDKLVYQNGVIFFNEPGDSLKKDLVNHGQMSDLQHISDLNYTIYKLEQYNAEKTDEIKKLDDKIKESLRQKNLSSAKEQLKVKKMLDLHVAKTFSTLANLQSLKIRVEDAHNNVLVSKVLKDNSEVLKILNKKATGKNNLDDVFDTLYDEIQNTDIISEKLGANVARAVNGDDQEIEDELAQLETEVQKEKEAEEDSKLQEIEEKLQKLKIPSEKPVSSAGEAKKEDTKEKVTLYA